MSNLRSTVWLLEPMETWIALKSRPGVKTWEMKSNERYLSGAVELEATVELNDSLLLRGEALAALSSADNARELNNMFAEVVFYLLVCRYKEKEEFFRVE